MIKVPSSNFLIKIDESPSYLEFFCKYLQSRHIWYTMPYLWGYYLVSSKFWP